jgi:REP element-mobilizing transposase RayT
VANHVHVIMRSKDGNLSDVVRDFKKYTAKQIFEIIETSNKESRKEWLEMIFKYYAKFNKRAVKKQFWTHENHAVELSTNEMIESRINYIHENPVRAGWVEKAEDYLYCSARNYADMPALIQIIKIGSVVNKCGCVQLKLFKTHP